MAPPKVLVIGSGYAGTVFAVQAAAYADVTLVSKVAYFDLAIANARTLVEPSFTVHTLVDAKDFKPLSQFVLGEVTALTDKTATLKDGTTIEFDFAVIATGSTVGLGKGAAPDVAGRNAEIQALNSQLVAATAVVVVGGGPTGVELAGEIATDYPDKKVTLVHSGAALLPGTAPRLQKAAAAWFKAHGVTVLLNDRVESPPEGGPITTKAGTDLGPALVIWATGIKVNTSFMLPALADAVESTGAVKVDKFFRVEGHPTVFAIGDVTNIDEPKLAFLAEKHAELLAQNLKLVVEGAPEAKLVAWKPSMGMPKIAIISVGRKYGLFQVGWFTLTGWLPGLLKGKWMASLLQPHSAQVKAAPAAK